MSDWRQAVDLAALERWMDARGLGVGPIEAPERLGGGTQNILLRFRRGADDFVLRRPPLHKRAESDEVMRREMRVLAALAGTEVPHPTLVAGEQDANVLGAAFYLMCPVDGFNPAQGLPASYAECPEWRRDMGHALVDAAAALAALDPGVIGLGDLGRLDGWLERQPGRWRRQFESYGGFADWDGTAMAASADRLAAWLDANRPEALRPGLIHGDYHLANVLFRHDSPTLAAIVDWELATLGDPLLDLGWLLATWPDGDHPAIVPVTPWDGVSDPGEIADRYLAATGRSTRDAHWFAVLACLKLGAILEGTHARACAGLAPRDTGDRLHAQAHSLFDRGLARIQKRTCNGL